MRTALALAFVLASASAHAQFKCVAPGGAVAYQQTPCAAVDRTAAVPAAAPGPTIVRSTRGVKVGMQSYELYEAAGYPEDRHVTETAAGKYVQHVYLEGERRVYVYTTNGVVTAVQR